MADEIKDSVYNLEKAVHDMRQKNDELHEQFVKKGEVDPLLKDHVERLNADIDKKQEELTAKYNEMQERVEKAETIAARKTGMPAEKEEELEAKARQFASFCARERHEAVPEGFDAKGLKDYRQKFLHWMRKGDMVGPEVLRALSVGSDQDGGYTVEPDTSGRIVQAIYETSPMRQVASQQTISTDALEGLYDLDEASTGWVGERGSRSSTGTPQLGEWRIPTHELYAMPEATQKVLDDSAIDLEGWLAQKTSSKMARVENTAFVSGNGVDKPRGFTTYGAGTNIPGTIERFYTSSDGAFPASPDGGDVLLDMIYGTKAPYRQNARFFMNRTTLGAVRKLKNSDGDYLWQPGIASGQPSQLLGYPILEFEDMDDFSTTDALAIAFGDMGAAYQIVDRQGIRVLRDPFSNKPYVQFYTTKRVGGDVINFEAIKLLQFGSA